MGFEWALSSILIFVIEGIKYIWFFFFSLSHYFDDGFFLLSHQISLHKVGFRVFGLWVLVASPPIGDVAGGCWVVSILISVHQANCFMFLKQTWVSFYFYRALLGSY